MDSLKVEGYGCLVDGQGQYPSLHYLKTAGREHSQSLFTLNVHLFDYLSS